LAIHKALPQPDNKDRTAVEFKAPCVYQTRARVIGHERAAVENEGQCHYCTYKIVACCD
jgi:hypothetical protein